MATPRTPPHSTNCLKEIKALDAERCCLSHTDHIVPNALLDKFDAKKVAHLKREIQRTGLVLAKHAEENALSKYRSGLGVRGRKTVARRKLHMIVIRINKRNDITDSKPCSHCVDVMRSYGIRKVTYSTKSGDFVTESLALIVSVPSVGYRSMERTIQVLDDMLAFYANGIG